MLSNDKEGYVIININGNKLEISMKRFNMFCDWYNKCQNIDIDVNTKRNSLNEQWFNSFENNNTNTL